MVEYQNHAAVYDIGVMVLVVEYQNHAAEYDIGVMVLVVSESCD